MTKRITALLLAVLTALSLTACGAKRPSAQQVVEQAIAAVKEMDMEAMQAYWGDGTLDAAGSITETETDEQALELLGLMTQKLTYTVTGSEEDEKAGTATVSVEFTNVNMAKVMAELISGALSDVLTYALLPADQQPTEEELTAKYMDDLAALIAADDAETVTAAVDIPLVLEDDQWVIADAQDAADAMLGGVLSYATSMAEQFGGLTE